MTINSYIGKSEDYLEASGMSETLRFQNTNYFIVPLEKLRPSQSVTFPLYVYLRRNESMVMRYGAAQTPEKSELDTYMKKGLRAFYCPEQFLPAWKKYLESADFAPTRVPSIAQIKEMATNPNLTLEEKKKVYSDIGQKMVGVLCNVVTGDDDQKWLSLRECNEIAQSIVALGKKSMSARRLYDDLLMIQESDIEHSTAVSSLSVVFALTRGFSDELELAELSMGALLHDLGCSLLPPQIVNKPTDHLNHEEMLLFRDHAMDGAQLVEEFGAEVPRLAKAVIVQHHERFDSKGFPRGIGGFEIDERVQLVHLADAIADLLKGQINGKNLSPIQAFEHIKKRQTEKREYLVNPDLFDAINLAVTNSQAAGKVA